MAGDVVWSSRELGAEMVIEDEEEFGWSWGDDDVVVFDRRDEVRYLEDLGGEDG